MKHKGLKVKRTRKNLYKRRKSKGRKVGEVILVIVVIAALVFVGYSVAPPLIKFFSGHTTSQTESSGPAWTPPITEETTTTTATTTPPPVQTPPEKQELSAVLAPDSALKNQAALKKFVEDAKNKGYDKILFTVKNTTGELLYASQVDSVKDNSIVIKGTLTAAQITKECKAVGIIPIAAMSTLLDRTVAKVMDNAGYRMTDEAGSWGWLDAAAENGGKPWASPFETNTPKYFSALTKELSDAGFEEIILQNTIFPKFGSYDRKILPAKVFADNRSDALAKLAQYCAAAASKSDTLVQIDLAELITMNTATYKATAEIWQSRQLMPDCKLLVTLDSADLGTEIKINDKTSIAVSKDAAKAISQTFTIAKQITGNADMAVGISNSAKLSAEQKASVKKVFTEMGYENIIFM